MPISIVRVVDSGGGYTTVLANDGNTYTVRGNAAWRNNNPGNLRPGSLTNGLGAIGTASAGDNGQFLVFPDYQTGLAAQQALQFNTPSYSNLTIAQAIQRYAPAGDNNNPAAYAQSIASAIGVPVTTRLADLTPQQQTAYIAAQQGVENNRPGTITGVGGASVPPELSSLFGGGTRAAPAANVTTNTAGPDDRPSMASLYGAAPPPLTPPTPPPSFLPSGNSWSTPLTSAAPPLPIPRPATPSIAPPVPMPTAPWLQPVAGPPAAPQPLVRLAGGGMISVGLHPSPDGSHMMLVTDDGKGNAVVTKQLNPGEIPGVIDPLSENGKKTVAGSAVGKAIGQGYNDAKGAVEGAASTAAANVGSAANSLVSGAGSLLSGLFGSKPPPVPAAPSFLPSSGKDWSTPLTSGNSGSQSQGSSAPPPSFLPSGNTWSTPLAPPAPPSPPPAPVTQQVINPAYVTWEKAQSAQSVYPGDLSQGGIQGNVYPGDLSQGGVHGGVYPGDLSQGGISKPAPPPPPKYITQTVAAPKPVIPPMPMPIAPWLSPVMPGSATFGTDPLSQLIAKSKLGGPIQFLGGAQNDYGYLNPAASAMGVSAADLHAALMAKQAKAPGYYQTNPNGTPALAMNGQQVRSSPYVNSATGMVSTGSHDDSFGPVPWVTRGTFAA